MDLPSDTAGIGGLIFLSNSSLDIQNDMLPDSGEKSLTFVVAISWLISHLLCVSQRIFVVAMYTLYHYQLKCISCLINL